VKGCVHVCIKMQCCFGNWVIGYSLYTSVLTKWGTRLVFATTCIGFWLWASAGLCGLCDWSRLVCLRVSAPLSSCTDFLTSYKSHTTFSQCRLYYTSYTELGKRMALSDMVVACFKAPYKLLIKNQLHLYIYIYSLVYIFLSVGLNEQKHVGDNKLKNTICNFK